MTDVWLRAGPEKGTPDGARSPCSEQRKRYGNRLSAQKTALDSKTRDRVQGRYLQLDRAQGRHGAGPGEGGAGAGPDGAGGGPGRGLLREGARATRPACPAGSRPRPGPSRLRPQPAPSPPPVFFSPSPRRLQGVESIYLVRAACVFCFLFCFLQLPPGARSRVPPPTPGAPGRPHPQVSEPPEPGTPPKHHPRAQLRPRLHSHGVPGLTPGRCSWVPHHPAWDGLSGLPIWSQAPDASPREPRSLEGPGYARA